MLGSQSETGPRADWADLGNLTLGMLDGSRRAVASPTGGFYTWIKVQAGC